MRAGPSTSLGAARLNCRNKLRSYLSLRRRPELARLEPCRGSSKSELRQELQNDSAKRCWFTCRPGVIGILKNDELGKLVDIFVGQLVRLDVGLLNNRGERFALLAGEVCKGLAGKAGELDCKGIEAFA